MSKPSLHPGERLNVAIVPAGLRAREAAAFIGIGRSLFYRLNRDGLIPAANLLDGSVPIWNADELRDWLAEGAPPRTKWDWEAARRRRTR